MYSFCWSIYGGIQLNLWRKIMKQFPFEFLETIFFFILSFFHMNDNHQRTLIEHSLVWSNGRIHNEFNWYRLNEINCNNFIFFFLFEMSARKLKCCTSDKSILRSINSFRISIQLGISEYFSHLVTMDKI